MNTSYGSRNHRTNFAGPLLNSLKKYRSYNYFPKDMTQAQDRWDGTACEGESGGVSPGIAVDGSGHRTQPRGVSRQKFSAEEDELLLSLVDKYGTQNWKCVMLGMHGRTARQCRERFKYYLEPSLNKNTWTEAEDHILMMRYHELGPRWARIAAFLKNRTPIDLKNRFHLLQRSGQKGITRISESETVKSEPEARQQRLPPIDTFLDVVNLGTGRL